MSSSRAFIVCLGLLLLTGCTRSVNARLELGALNQTGTFAPSSDPVERNPGTPRSGWDTTIIIAPIDGIVHGPTLRYYRPPRKTDHPRTYGLLPTSGSALEHQSSSYGSVVLRTLDELGDSITSIIDPLYFHYEFTGTPWSPMRVWKRSRQDTSWSSGRVQELSHDE